MIESVYQEYDPEDIYFVCAPTNYSDIPTLLEFKNLHNISFPFSGNDQLGGYYGDFNKNFIAIGNDNTLVGMLTTSASEDQLRDMIAHAEQTYEPLYLKNPVDDIVLDGGESVTIDLNDVFYSNGGEDIEISLVGNSNPSLIDLSLDNFDLTITSIGSDNGSSLVEIKGSDGTNEVSDTFMVWVGKISAAIIDLDGNNNSANKIKERLEPHLAGEEVAILSEVPQNILQYGALFVTLGVFPDNHQLTGDEGDKLSQFVDNGGSLYMEGADTWCYDDPTPVHSKFGIDEVSDGVAWSGAALNQVGQEQCSGMSISYFGDNAYMDEIAANSNGVVLFENGISPTVVVNPTTKCVGSVFEFGGLNNDDGLVDKYMAILTNIMGISGSSSLEEYDNVIESFKLYQNFPNPFNPTTTIKFDLVSRSNVNLTIFNSNGEFVRELIDGEVETGLNTINFDGSSLNSGIYFYRLSVDGVEKSGRMVLLK